MNDNVNIFHNVIENVGGSKIPSDSHGEQIPVFCSMSFHLIGSELGPPRPSDLDSAFEEKVYDVGTDKACSASDENMAEREGDYSCQGLLHLRAVILTEE